MRTSSICTLFTLPINQLWWFYNTCRDRHTAGIEIHVVEFLLMVNAMIGDCFCFKVFISSDQTLFSLELCSLGLVLNFHQVKAFQNQIDNTEDLLS